MNICKGHIYIIFCHINPKIYYVGSTFNQLKYRWSEHKNTKRNKCSIKKYFDEYGIENFSIKLIKSYNVYREHNRDNQHLRAYEQLWINKFRNSCNMQHSFNPLKKLCDKEYDKKYMKKYRQDNKKKLKKKKKEWDEKNKEQIKQYYIDNKDKIKEKRKQKYTCECGSTIIIKEKSRHLKSIKHQNYIKNNINNI